MSLRCRTRAALVQHREQAVRAVDVARQHDDEVALIAQIVGQAAAVALIESGELAHEMLAHREQPLLGLARGRRAPAACAAAAARLHVGFEERLLARPQLDAERERLCSLVAAASAATSWSRRLRAPQRQRSVPRSRSTAAIIAKRHKALLPVDDLEQARLALARLRQVAAGAVEQQDRAEEIVGLAAAVRAAKPRRREDILEQLARFLGGPRVRPLVTGNRKVEG